MGSHISDSPEIQSLHWRKSSYSHPNGNDCVEIAFGDGAVGVRDSKLGDTSPILAFTPHQWQTFLDSAPGTPPAG